MSTYAPPPPRPSAVNEHPRAVNEDRSARSTKIGRGNRDFGWGIVVGAVIVAIGCAFYLAATDAAATPPVNEDPAAVVNEDPYGGVPQCTDAIADAGGMCHGEPVNEPVEADTSALAEQAPVWESPDGEAPWPYTTGETLVCGQGAKPAIDHRDDAIGWWAYCEPALVESGK